MGPPSPGKFDVFPSLRFRVALVCMGWARLALRALQRHLRPVLALEDWNWAMIDNLRHIIVEVYGLQKAVQEQQDQPGVMDS